MCIFRCNAENTLFHLAETCGNCSMNEAKVPDSDSDWRTLDIFIFSNGQHMTPPRKYRLSSADLDKWDSTLTTLAHSQYGSILSSIDLYTVKGQRVFTPIEISDGNAYVAVPPHDTFIPAGYSEYLLRASRSREKRQNKAKSNVQLEQHQDEVDGNIQETAIEHEEVVENMETLNEEVTNVITPTGGAQSILQSKLLPQHSLKNNSTIRQWGKNNSNKQNSTMLRKQNSSLSPNMVRKTSIKLKENPVRKNLKLNTIKGPNSGSTIITNSNNQSKTYSIGKSGKSPDSTPRNSNERSKFDKTSQQVSIVEFKSLTEETEPQVSIIAVSPPPDKTVSIQNSPVLENHTDDTDLTVVKKQESDIRSQMLYETDKSTNVVAARQTRLSSVVPILMPIEESKYSAVNKEVDNVFRADRDVINNTSLPSSPRHTIKSPLHINENTQEPHDDTIKISKKPTVESFIAVIDKGDVVNLNLNIEVRKCEGIITSQDTKPHNFLSEKNSQVNLEQEIVKTISKRSILSNKVTVEEDKTKVVVIQCSCCENHNLNDILRKIDAGPVKLDDKKYVIVLPDPQYNKSVERNERLQEDFRAMEKTVSLAPSSIITPVKKVFATTSVQRLTTIKSSQEIITTHSNLAYHEQKISQQNVEVLNSNKTCTNQKSYNVEPAVLIETRSKFGPQITFVNNSTQTEWHSMLLEARRHEDGRYSFYLPSLQVLKYYGY